MHANMIRLFVGALFTLGLSASFAAPNTVLSPYRSTPNTISLRTISDVTPYDLRFPNNIGISQEEDYVSDLKQYWSYSSLYYYRKTIHGIFGARVNYANRYSMGGEQYQLEAYPKISPNVYAALSVGLSNTSQQVFPKYQYSVEPYFNLPKGYEASIGQRFIRSYDVNIYTYTGSIGKNVGNYFVWLRPYHYTPKSVDFFEAGIKRYFEGLDDTFVSFKVGTGKIPDIGDIPPLNQITILSANTFSIDGQFHATRCMLVRLGVGYARQVYQSGNVREITNGSINLTWKF